MAYGMSLVPRANPAGHVDDGDLFGLLGLGAIGIKGRFAAYPWFLFLFLFLFSSVCFFLFSLMPFLTVICTGTAIYLVVFLF